MASPNDLPPGFEDLPPGFEDEVDGASGLTPSEPPKPWAERAAGTVADFLGGDTILAHPTRLAQKANEGALPGANRIVSALEATAAPLVPSGASQAVFGDPKFADMKGWIDRYDASLRRNQAVSADTQQRFPVGSTVTQIGASIPTALAVGNPAPSASAAGRVLQSAGEGATWAGTYAAGDLPPGVSLAEGAKRVGTAAGVGGAVAGGLSAVPEAWTATGPQRNELADWLREKAGGRNIKAAGGIQSDITRARKQIGPGGVNDGRAELLELGAEMGDKGVVRPFSGPQGTFDRAAALMDDSGQRMGAILDAADTAASSAGGPAPSLNNILTDALQTLQALKSNPNPGAQAAAARFEDTLNNYVSIIAKDRLSFREAHQLRRWVDKEVYGLRGNKDPWKDDFSDAMSDLRGAISKEIDSKVGASVQQSPEWQAANRDYQVGAEALKFADKGLDRGLGNNQVSPMEFLGGMGAAVGGTTAAGPAGGLAGLVGTGAVMLGRRYGSGVQGYVYGKLSNALRSNPAVLGPYAQPIAAMAEKYGPEGAVAAYWVLIQKDPTARALLDPVVNDELNNMDPLAAVTQ